MINRFITTIIVFLMLLAAIPTVRSVEKVQQTYIAAVVAANQAE